MLLKYISLFCGVLILYVVYSSTWYLLLKAFIDDFYFNKINLFYTRKSEEIVDKNGDILFTTSALQKYTNLDDGLYLSILGQVFDVTSGAKHYGPGESYHAFTGRDGSAAFITGDFSESGLTDDTSSLTNKQIQSLMTWIGFYRRTYVYKGKLIGRYYNKNGSPTNERLILEEKVQIAKKNDLTEEEKKLKFPPCNVEWDANTGTKVWCTKNSGGIARNWIGVPRMYYDNSNSKQYRCACIRIDSQEFEENKEMIKVFKGCAENATHCILETVNV